VRVFLIAALVLFVLGLICIAASTTIAGADWPVWLIGGLIAWVIDALLGSSWRVRGPS
jgi:hypothetical protein